MLAVSQTALISGYLLFASCAQIDSPSPEPEIDHAPYPAQASSTPVKSSGGLPYTFDRLSSKCAYRPYPMASCRAYTEGDAHTLSANDHSNTAYNHLEPRGSESDSSNPASLVYPPSYVNVSKSCDCHLTSDTTDIPSCDSHVRCVDSASVCTDYQNRYYRKTSASYYYNCIYCAQLNRTGSYHNLNTSDNPSNGGAGVRSGGVRSDGGGSGDGTRVGGSGEFGELSYFEVLDFAHQIASGMAHLEQMKVCWLHKLCM